MKKVTVIIAILICFTCLVGCTNETEKETVSQNKLKYADSKATVELESGIVELTSNEIKEIYSENRQNFKNNYFGKKITFIGTVDSVSSNSIIFKEGWEVALDSWNTCNSISSDLRKNDEVLVISWIFDAFGTRIEVETQDSSNGTIIMMADKNFSREELISIANSFYNLYVFMDAEYLTYYNPQVSDGLKNGKNLASARIKISDNIRNYNFSNYEEDIRLLASKFDNLSMIEDELNIVSTQTEEYANKFLEAYTETGYNHSKAIEVFELGKEILEKNQEIREKIINEVTK